MSGDYALFANPVMRVGGEKCSYHIPTYEALKGILQSIYWKPTLVWIIDAVRVMNGIQTETKGVRPIVYNGGNDLAYYTYLKNVSYQVRAHFEWNENRKELIHDRNENKHHNIAKREVAYGFMYHGITYADEAVLEEDKGKMTVRFWNPVMKKGGIIEFQRPEKCTIKRYIRQMGIKSFGEGEFTGLKEFEEEESAWIG